MPEGISAAVEDGFATIEFLDLTLAGPALARLLEVGGPELIDVDTGGARRSYIVPESIARDAGLIDGVAGKRASRRAPAKKARK